MTHAYNLPLALQRAQMAFWMRTGELMHESRGRWLELADHLLTRDVREAGVGTREMEGAADWPTLTSLPMDAGWRLLNHGVGNARDLALTAFNSHAAFDAGMRRALAQWQVEAAQALSASRNGMPLNGMLKNLMQTVDSEPSEPASKDGHQ